MRPNRRQFWLLAGMGLALPAGCGDKRKDSEPNPDLGPPPNHGGPPPRKNGGPPEKRK